MITIMITILVTTINTIVITILITIMITITSASCQHAPVPGADPRGAPGGAPGPGLPSAEREEPHERWGPAPIQSPTPGRLWGGAEHPRHPSAPVCCPAGWAGLGTRWGGQQGHVPLLPTRTQGQQCPEGLRAPRQPPGVGSVPPARLSAHPEMLPQPRPSNIHGLRLRCSAGAPRPLHISFFRH